jgi:hypothetical protein
MSCIYCKSNKKIVENENYCIYHIELKNLTLEEINNGVKCNRCPRLAFKTKLCKVCITKSTQKRKINKDLLCQFNFNDNNCIFKKMENSNYCITHDYLTEYTDEMLNNLSFCSGCKKHKFIENNYKTCENCRNRVKQTKNSIIEEPIKTNIEEPIKTNIEEPIKTNIEELIKNDNLCSNFKRRGCKNIATDGFKRCLKCREKEKEQYNKTKNNFIKINENINGNEKCCLSCHKNLDINTHFMDFRNNETKNCLSCRTKQNELDKKRNKEKRNELARICSQKPKNLEVKKTWRENNKEKINSYSDNYKKKQIEKLGCEEYLKKQAENQKNNREKNPEKTKEYNIERNNNINYAYTRYKRDAFIKNLKFNFTKEEFFNLVKSNCHYCNTIQSRGFNGIDKLDILNDYVIDNCVSCCFICNIMKACLSHDVFILRIIHILSYHNYIDKSSEFYYMNYKLCPHTNGTSYCNYINRAKKINVCFNLTEDQFNLIKSKNCYLCGLSSNDTHVNGIDRFDSDKGYDIDNIYACCSSCNYLKNDINISVLLNKFILIFENYKSNGELIKIINKIKENNNDLLENYNVDNIKFHLNKKTKEELTEIKIINTQTLHDRKIERFKTENIINRENDRKLMFENKKLNNEIENEKNEKQKILKQFMCDENDENQSIDDINEEEKNYELIDNQTILNNEIINNLILKIINKHNEK